MIEGIGSSRGGVHATIFGARSIARTIDIRREDATNLKAVGHREDRDLRWLTLATAGKQLIIRCVTCGTFVARS
jgi:hypothetical protein